MKPIIGVVELPYKDLDGDLVYEVPNEIIERIIRSGGLPIGLHSTQLVKYQEKNLKEIEELTDFEKTNIDTLLKLCDGIIKPGALRIYNYEKYIYEYAKKNNMPYLGICAGMQLMTKGSNVKNETNINHRSNEEYVHKLKIIKDTLLYDVLKKEEIMVNSRHNYHINDASDLNVNAYAPDGIIEGIEDSNLNFHLGVQWHPESLNDTNSDRIFDTLIDSAKKYHKIK